MTRSFAARPTCKVWLNESETDRLAVETVNPVSQIANAINIVAGRPTYPTRPPVPQARSRPRPLGEGRTHRVEQRFLAERLGQERGCSETQGFRGNLTPTMRRDEDNRGLVCLG